MIKKIVQIFFLLSLLTSAGYSQAYDKDNYLQNLLPLSPNASALQKYIDYPVDYSTGVPNISYNLYTVEVDGTKIPITLNYHAGGIKVSDIGTSVGLGWTLQAGGGIFRQINGLPDEHVTTGFLFNSMANSTYVNQLYVTLSDNATSQNILQQIAQNRWDMSQDHYSYALPDNSGTFFFNKNKTLTLSEKSNLIIKDSIVNNGFVFTAMDDNGNQYSFDQPEFSSATTVNTMGGDQHDQLGVTDWMLTQIRTPKKRKIDFTYLDYPSSYSMAAYDLFDLKTAVNGTGYNGTEACDPATCSIGPTTLSLNNKNLNHDNGLLQSIVTDNTTVHFIYSSVAASNWQMELDSIKIYDGNRLVKLLHFDYSFFNGDPRLKLTGFETINLLDGNNEQYQFKYYDGGVRSLPASDSRAQDLFGYYNGANTNITLIKSSDPGFPAAYVGNRNVDTDRILNGTLNEIILPTGGKVDYSFEANYISGGSYFGGLRLRQKMITDNIGNISESDTYLYDNGYGTRALNNASVIATQLNDLLYVRKQFNSNSYPINQLADTYFGKSGYAYLSVTEDKKSATGETLRTIYNYKSYLIGRNIKAYPESTLILTQNGSQYNLTKKIVQTFTQLMVDSLTTPEYVLGSGQLWLNYTFDNGDQMCCKTIYSGVDSSESFSQTLMEKTAETDTTFTDAGKVAETHNYFYENPLHIYRTRETFINSDGSLLSTNYKYPLDMISGGLDPSGFYRDMANRNMVSPVITTDKYKNSNLLSSFITQYRSDWEADKSIITPSYVDELNLGQSMGKVNFLKYDTANGNLLQLAKENDRNESLLYDYKSLLVTAHAINAAYSDIAATSFEADGHGNFSFTGIAQSNTGAFTGNKAYSLASGAILKSGLVTGTNYIVSYWSKTGSALVNGVTASSNLSRNGWNYYEHTITGTATVTINGTVVIDELRLYPATAQMITYTYNPLIGMTSQTGIDGRTNYYEYDGLNRLSIIRDHVKNIVKQWEYKYQVLPNSSPTVYLNASTSHAYTKNNCGGDSTGSAYTYAIAPGTYTSSVSQHSADSLAQRDVSLNGQLAANANGHCTMIYYNVGKSHSFTRDNCGPGYTPTSVTYSVNPGKYSSLISQAYVDSLAQNEVDMNGQARADSLGICSTPTPQNVKYGNTSADQMTLTMTNTVTGTGYSFTLPHTTGSVTAGQIPAGIYNASIGPSYFNTKTYNYKIGVFSQSGVNSASVSNITITTAITVLISATITQ